MVVGVAGRDFQNLKKIGKKLNWENFSNKQSLVYGVFTILVYTSLVLEWHLSNNCCCTTCADQDRGLKLKKKNKISENRLLEYPPPLGKNSWLICTCTIFYQTVLLCPHNLYLEAFNNLKLNSLYRSKIRTLRTNRFDIDLTRTAHFQSLKGCWWCFRESLRQWNTIVKCLVRKIWYEIKDMVLQIQRLILKLWSTNFNVFLTFL